MAAGDGQLELPAFQLEVARPFFALPASRGFLLAEWQVTGYCGLWSPTGAVGSHVRVRNWQVDGAVLMLVLAAATLALRAAGCGLRAATA